MKNITTRGRTQYPPKTPTMQFVDERNRACRRNECPHVDTNKNTHRHTKKKTTCRRKK